MTVERTAIVSIKLMLTEEEAKHLRTIVQNSSDPNEPVERILFRTTLYNDLNESLSHS